MSKIVVDPSSNAVLPVSGNKQYCYGGIVVALGESWESGQYYGMWHVINGQKGFKATPIITASGITIAAASNGIKVTSPNATTYVYAYYIGRAY